RKSAQTVLKEVNGFFSCKFKIPEHVVIQCNRNSSAGTYNSILIYYCHYYNTEHNSLTSNPDRNKAAGMCRDYTKQQTRRHTKPHLHGDDRCSRERHSFDGRQIGGRMWTQIRLSASAKDNS
uniref:Uncharacterized protein n=1 Tax=Gasterosteus aculeatus TaxID=69293 RepID=G3QAX4_GASAC